MPTPPSRSFSPLAKLKEMQGNLRLQQKRLCFAYGYAPPGAIASRRLRRNKKPASPQAPKAERAPGASRHPATRGEESASPTVLNGVESGPETGSSRLYPSAKLESEKLAGRCRCQFHKLDPQRPRQFEEFPVCHTTHLRLDLRYPVLRNVPAQPRTPRRQRVLTQLLPTTQRRYARPHHVLARWPLVPKVGLLWLHASNVGRQVAEIGMLP